MGKDRYIEMRCNPWGGRIACYDLLVTADGAVKVWDSVANHYTVCHSLTDQEMARARWKSSCCDAEAP